MNLEASVKKIPSIDDLPGADIVEEGLADVRAGRLTTAACLIFIASPRLTRAGLLSGHLAVRAEKEPELMLYRLLREEPGDAYSRYNALLRRLVSFERALDKRVGAEHV